jgi:hypothetical protein
LHRRLSGSTRRARFHVRMVNRSACFERMRRDIPLTMPLSIGLGGGIVCGADNGSPVWDKYKPPFKLTGTLYIATVDVSGELIKDDEQAMKIALARQ